MIKDLEQRMRPPRLGVIRLGIKKVAQSGKEYPAETPFFVCPPEIKVIYGDEPTSLPVYFPFSEPEQVLHSIFYVKRAGKTKVRQCDGEQFCEIERGGKDRLGPCEKDPANIYAPCPCGAKATARLSVLVAKTRLGIWSINLGGLQRIADLLGELRLYRAALGPLTKFPFDLERVPTEEQYFKADGTPAWRTGYPIKLRTPFATETALRLGAVEILDRPDELPAAPPQAALPTATVQAKPVIHDEDPTGDDEEETNGEDPWDISYSFKAAADIGVNPKEYERYLLVTYGTDVDNLPHTALGEQQRLFQTAKSPEAKKALRQAILAAAQKAERRGGQGRLV